MVETKIGVGRIQLRRISQAQIEEDIRDLERLRRMREGKTTRPTEYSLIARISWETVLDSEPGRYSKGYRDKPQEEEGNPY